MASARCKPSWLGRRGGLWTNPTPSLAPRLIFEDSLSCLNFNPRDREPSSQRASMQLLPGARAPNKMHTSTCARPAAENHSPLCIGQGRSWRLRLRSARGSRSDQATGCGMQGKRPPSMYVSRQSPKHSCPLRLTVWLKRCLDQPCACWTSLAIRTEVPAYRPHTRHQIQVCNYSRRTRRLGVTAITFFCDNEHCCFRLWPNRLAKSD